MSEETIPFSLGDAREFAVVALLGAGASPAMAASLARATVDADARSKSTVGFSHLVDYLESLVAGRISGKAEPMRTDPAPALIRIDADGGIAQLGFDLAYDDLVEKAKTFGIALFTQFNSYTSGELGDYVFRLAERGLVGLAATNGPALIAGSGSARPVYCTNPLAFAAPRKNGAPLLIDQSSSATAFANIREAAARGEPIPAGWAVDAAGQPTTDAKEAMKGGNTRRQYRADGRSAGGGFERCQLVARCTGLHERRQDTRQRPHGRRHLPLAARRRLRRPARRAVDTAFNRPRHPYSRRIEIRCPEPRARRRHPLAFHTGKPYLGFRKRA